MPRKPRQQSESGIYHVFARGSGRQLIYEDDADRRDFMAILGEAAEVTASKLYAYCLMGNHYHLVVGSEFDELSNFVHDINRRYAFRFNKRYDRTGHLFQSRFGSEPINSDSYFLEAIRYVHRNPIEARMTPSCDYPWSSYREYLEDPIMVKTDLAIDMLGGQAAFEEFHRHSSKESLLDDSPKLVRKSEQDIVAVARASLHGVDPGALKALSKPERDKHLKNLKESGLSLTDISLITGISRPTVSRALR